MPVDGYRGLASFNRKHARIGSPAPAQIPCVFSNGLCRRDWAELGVILPARGIRAIDKSRMIHNSATPKIEVDPETYEVRADGVHLTCEPATVLPLAQRYFLY